MKGFLKAAVMLVFFIACFLQVRPADADQVHRVKNGETLYLISKQYGISTDDLLQRNGYIRNPHKLFINQVLIIPDKQRPNTYRVQPGDTLFKISRKLGTGMQALASANELKDWNQLYPGQELIIPRVEAASAGSSAKTYRVQQGDSLFTISQKFGVRMEKIAEANSLVNWNYLYVGQELVIPENTGNGSASSSRKTIDYSQAYKGIFYLSGPPSTNKIALTFDDGPDSIYTGRVLDVLSRYNVPATFFLMGKRCSDYPWVVSRIVNEGHVVGNHTWSHPQLNKVSQERIANEITSTEEIIRQITGLRTALVRPPYGAVSHELMQFMNEQGYKVINWSVDSEDWKDENDVNDILINTLPNIKGGSIILLHSAGGHGQSKDATVSVLHDLIYTLAVQGYEFVTVDKLLAVPPYK